MVSTICNCAHRTVTKCINAFLVKIANNINELISLYQTIFIIYSYLVKCRVFSVNVWLMQIIYSIFPHFYFVSSYT